MTLKNNENGGEQHWEDARKDRAAQKLTKRSALQKKAQVFCTTATLPSYLQSSPGHWQPEWDTEMLFKLALGLYFEQVLPKLTSYTMFVTFIATYLQIFRRKYEELTKILQNHLKSKILSDRWSHFDGSHVKSGCLSTI